MKKLICILLIALMGMTAFAEAPGNRLGWDTLNALYDGSTNQVFSPVSLALALSMAADGAKGDTRAEILSALNSEDADWKSICDSLEKSGLKIANAAFVSGELDVHSDYVDQLKNIYSAEWFEMGADVVQRINDWTNAHTDGLIEKLLDQAPSADTQLIYLNAVAMDAKWLIPFDADSTSDAAFHAPDGDKDVPTMHNTDYFEYGETESTQLLRLKYQNSALTMLLALPKDGHSEREILSALSAQGLEYFGAISEEKRVRLALPKVDISVENSLNDALKAAGVQAAFTGNADFSGVSDTSLQISSVIQKARLVVDEDGTKAAAVTEIVMAASALITEDPIEFRADHPFVAVIADESTGTVCFAAVIANPSEN